MRLLTYNDGTKQEHDASTFSIVNSILPGGTSVKVAFFRSPFSPLRNCPLGSSVLQADVIVEIAIIKTISIILQNSFIEMTSFNSSVFGSNFYVITLRLTRYRQKP